MIQDAAMLWSGGKDSALALHEARRHGYRVVCLATFVPPQANFLAHPLGFIKLQAQALRLPHYVLPIREPYEQGYELALSELHEAMGVNHVITGDIAEVAGNPNWIRQRSRATHMEAHTPLWGRDRERLLWQILNNGFSTLFSCVKSRWLSEDWVGRELSDAAIADLCKVRERTGLDLCGEEGEYHTLVTDGPGFSHRIVIRSAASRRAESLVYLDIQEMELVEK
jgi:diphthine-ammonia ligase